VPALKPLLAVEKHLPLADVRMVASAQCVVAEYLIAVDLPIVTHKFTINRLFIDPFINNLKKVCSI